MLSPSDMPQMLSVTLTRPQPASTSTSCATLANSKRPFPDKLVLNCSLSVFATYYGSIGTKLTHSISILNSETVSLCGCKSCSISYCEIALQANDNIKSTVYMPSFTTKLSWIAFMNHIWPGRHHISNYKEVLCHFSEYFNIFDTYSNLLVHQTVCSG